MKKLKTLFLPILMPVITVFILCTGCEGDENIEDKKTRIWRPDPSAIVSDNQVKLNWLNMSIYELIYRPYEIVHPDEFEIYMSSESVSNFTKLIELKNDGEYSHTISNLKNNKTYYFYVTSKKKGYKSLISDTIMVIPNIKPTIEDLFTVQDPHTNTSISLGSEKNKIAYLDKHYEWDGGENCCISIAIFISNLDGSEAELLKIKSNSPDWSSSNDTLILTTTYGEVNQGQGIFKQLAMYDFKNEKLIKLTNENFGHFNPTLSQDGKKILYESTRESPDYHTSSIIWLLDLITLEKHKAVELLSNNLISAGSPNWINNEKFLFHGKNTNYKNNIFKASINSKKLELVVQSPWDDFNPSISPDNNKIAFVSDRSGRNEVWLYNCDDKSYRQLTGYPGNGYISESWNEIEWIDNSTIMFNFGENRLIRLKIK